MNGVSDLIEYLSKVRECTLHIVLVIEAEAAHCLLYTSDAADE